MRAIGISPQLANPLIHRYVLNVQQFSPGSLPHGPVASPDQCFRPFPTKTLEGTQMAFVNEVVSDEDIAKYNLPFAPSTKCYWTRDKERDYYLWGGISADYARGYEPGRSLSSICQRQAAFALFESWGMDLRALTKCLIA